MCDCFWLDRLCAIFSGLLILKELYQDFSLRQPLLDLFSRWDLRNPTLSKYEGLLTIWPVLAALTSNFFHEASNDLNLLAENNLPEIVSIPRPGSIWDDSVFCAVRSRHLNLASVCSTLMIAWFWVLNIPLVFASTSPGIKMVVILLSTLEWCLLDKSKGVVLEGLLLFGSIKNRQNLVKHQIPYGY